MGTSVITMVLGVAAMIMGSEILGLALIVISGIAWNESHYLHLKDLIENKK